MSVPNLNWYQLEPDKALDILKSSPEGLGKDEVLSRKARFGPNRIQKSSRINPWLIFFKQFKDILIIILILATLVSLLIGEVLEGIVIFCIIILCAILGFFQEYRSEKAVEALKRMASPTARVVRDGKECTIPAEDIVPGDIVCIQTGDIVPADARLLEASNLTVNESVLTGESIPVLKKTEPILGKEMPLGDRSNILFASTEVTRGRGKGLVVETGMNTEFGRIAGLLQMVKSEKTPLEEQMGVIGKWLGFGCLGVCIIASILGILRGYPLLEMFVWGVSLAVAAVPEALPAVVTSALAIGVQKMAKEKAIVKRLAAVETLGCTTVICSDKTGTLTKNEMTVKRIWINGGYIHVSGSGYKPAGGFIKDGKSLYPSFYPLLKRLLEIGTLCNDATLEETEGEWGIHGDPTEGALIVAGIKGGVDHLALRDNNPRVGEIPFDETRKMMSVINDIHMPLGGIEMNKDDSLRMRVVSVKGAPEILICHCTRIQLDDGISVMTDDVKKGILAANEEMAKEALRVLALAWREIPKSMSEFESESISESIEDDLIFCGLVGMIDPPRDEVPIAVKNCLKAGIRPVMVTGDHRATAQAIAESVGIFENLNKDMDKEGLVLDGEGLNNMSDQDIDKIIQDVRVFARVSPEHKLRIVEAYQRQGEVVAMTGDGVNDAPALKKADIGVAMGIKGTDVSREAADMVLADDNFATIIAAVKEGRAAFENIKKYLIFLLSCNIGEILILAGSFFLGLPIPLIAIQILWVNLTTDGLPALALGIDPHEPDIMANSPRGRTSFIFSPWVVGLILIISFHISYVLFIVFDRFLANGGLEKAQTMVFLNMILLEMFNAFNCRSAKYSIKRMLPWENLWLVGAVAISLLISILVIHIPFLNVIFHTQPLTLKNWLEAVFFSSTIILTVEIVKGIRRIFVTHCNS